MLPFRALGATLFLVFLQVAGPAAASDRFMLIGGETSAPRGHLAFCERYPGECTAPDAYERPPLQLDETVLRLVAEVNRKTNARIAPVSDMEIYGVEEHWAFPNDRGDCEDYALEKRRLLVEAGVAPSNLLLTVVRKPDGEGHAVLTLRTTSGDFVLDNLDTRVLPFAATPYAYHKRQSSAHPARWMAIDPVGDIAVAALP